MVSITRRHLILFISLILFLGSCVLYGLTNHIAHENLRGYVNPTQSTELPFKTALLGVNAELTQYSPRELLENLALMEDMGVHWVRQFVRWDSVEIVSNEFDWTKYDAIITPFEGQHLKLIVVLYGTPSWERENNTTFSAPPNNLNAWSNFVRLFTQRYEHIIDYYQIWDEPNLYNAWGTKPPKPIQYLGVLQVAYQVIHSYDETATVLSASLAPTTENTINNISDWQYLEDLYIRGLKAVTDGIGAKAYGFNVPPDDRSIDANSLNFSRVIHQREIMEQYDDAQKPLWVTNFGWNSLPNNWAGKRSIWGEVSSENQEMHTLNALKRADREWAWVGGVILHHWQPEAQENDPQWGFSLLSPQGETKALYHSIKNSPLPLQPQNGLYHPRNPYIQYSGLWTLGDLGADVGWLETSDSQLSLEFYGTEVSILTRQGNYVAFLYPKVNNKPPNALPQDNQGNGYLFLRSATLRPELKNTLVSSNLPQETHVLMLTADKGWDQWAIAGFGVSDGNLEAPYQAQKNIALFSIFITAIALFVSLRQFNLFVWVNQLRLLSGSVTPQLNAIGAFVASLILMLGIFFTWGDGTPNIFRKEAYNLGIATLVTGGLIALEPSLIVVALSVMVLWLFIYNHINVGLCLTVFWSPFFLVPVEIYQYAFPMAELLLLITFSAWLLQQSVVIANAYKSKISLKFNLHLMDQLWVLWVLVGLITLLWSVYQSIAFTEWRTLILEPALFYMILRTSSRHIKDLRQLVYTLIFSGLLVCVIGLITFSQGQGIITAEEGSLRLASVYGSPNNVALLIGRFTPFLLAFGLAWRGYRRWLAIIGLLIVLITLVLTQSVGGLVLGIPAGLGFVILLHFKRRALMPLLAFVSLGSASVLFLSQISVRFAKLFSLSEGTNFLRLRVWESALDIVSQFPITGIGLDQFLRVYRAEYVRPDAIWDMDLSHPHQIILDIWLRMSIFGLILFLVMQWCFWRVWRDVYLRIDLQERSFLIGCAGFMAATLAHGMIDNSIFVLDLAMLHALVIGIVINYATIDGFSK